MALYRYFQPARLPFGHQRTTFNTFSTIREANEAVRSAATKESAKRGSYAKFTPEQQAEVAKYASMHGMVVTSHHRFHTISRFHDNRYTASPVDPMEVYVRVYGSKIWVWSHVRRARKFLLEVPRANSRKYAPATISRYIEEVIKNRTP